MSNQNIKDLPTGFRVKRIVRHGYDVDEVVNPRNIWLCEIEREEPIPKPAEKRYLVTACSTHGKPCLECNASLLFQNGPALDYVRAIPLLEITNEWIEDAARDFNTATCDATIYVSQKAIRFVLQRLGLS